MAAGRERLARLHSQPASRPAATLLRVVLRPLIDRVSILSRPGGRLRLVKRCDFLPRTCQTVDTGYL
jgi:hypothetical protein